MYGKNEETVLNNFDFSEIEEKDPSLAEGHHLLYDREVPFELRLEDSNGPQDVASFEAIRAKILLGGDESNPSQIRIELSCENDLFFHFTSDVDEEVFKAMQDNQKLCINFNEYTNFFDKWCFCTNTGYLIQLSVFYFIDNRRCNCNRNKICIRIT